MNKKNLKRITDTLLISTYYFPHLLADSLLNPLLRGKLGQIIENIIDDFNAGKPNNGISEIEKRDALIETALNLIGMERKRVGFSEEETAKTLNKIIYTLKIWENAEGKAKLSTKSTIEKFLKELKRVGLGKSMVSKLAENVEKKLDANNLMESFIFALKHEIENNVYYKMFEKGMSKFGNDSATGLRFVRHFDFVQVSSNPVIAARAYEEFPELWDNFKKIVKINPDWLKKPEKYADEITMYATITSLLPNLLVFRPIALLSDFRDGLVSLQLNPFLAENPRATIKDAKQIYSILEKILYEYDAWLGWNPDIYNGRPNIVFKIAASSPYAIDITSALNSIGIGTNNTVTYSVSQELTLLIAETEGMARALKNGTPITQVYQTNMLGRFSDHLKDGESNPDKQEAIKYSGIYVTRKVYKLFFSPENRKEWQAYLKKRFKLSMSQVQEIFNKIDILPASKRNINDTYLVLGCPNITNTEFPTHQTKVWEESLKDGFNLEQYRDSIKTEPDPAILKTLLEIEDFRKAYELTPNLVEKLKKEIGIKVKSENGGLESGDWSKFGPVVKTMTEFKNAYLDFQKKVLEFVKSIKEE